MELLKDVLQIRKVSFSGNLGCRDIDSVPNFGDRSVYVATPDSMESVKEVLKQFARNLPHDVLLIHYDIEIALDDTPLFQFWTNLTVPEVISEFVKYLGG